MKKLIYTLLAVSMIFTACKKEEGCTDAIATNYNADAEDDDNSCIYSIVGTWSPNTINVNSITTATTAGLTVTMLDTTYTMNPDEAGIEGNIEFTNDGEVITTNNYSEIETDNYTTSGSNLTIINSDDGYGETNDVATYTVTKKNLTFTMSDTETETDMGTTITNTFDITFNCTRQ